MQVYLHLKNNELRTYFAISFTNCAFLWENVECANSGDCPTPPFYTFEWHTSKYARENKNEELPVDKNAVFQGGAERLPLPFNKARPREVERPQIKMEKSMLEVNYKSEITSESPSRL